MKSRFLKFLKDWMLVIGMISGAGAYLIYSQIPSIHTAGPVLEYICRKAQPILLFIMLFISFSRIEPRQLVFKRWHIRNLLIQVISFLALCLAVIWAMHSTTPAAAWILRHRILFESAMLCMICPTATACAVVTGKLGGDIAQVVMYTIIINLAVSIAVPLTVPLLYPQAGISFLVAFSRILAKVFPLLILPCLTAWVVRWLMPRFHNWVASKMNLSFYLWSISLTIAILMSTRAIVHSGCGIITLTGIALVSMLCCIFQFWAGRITGRRSDSRIEASQAFGQKNTVFGIWMGYTFWNPLVSVAGGFYTIWHNIHNTRQLYKMAQKAAVILAILVFTGCEKEDFGHSSAPKDKVWYELVSTDTVSSSKIYKNLTGYYMPVGPNLVRNTFLYHSVNKSDTLTLSGVACWPIGTQECSEIILENHFITVRWDQCPSQTPQPGMLICSSRKSFYVCADYQGLGLSRNLYQPYLNTPLIATQSIDCYKAAMQLLKDRGPALSDDYCTYNIGFSLGGAVALGVAKKIEQDPELRNMVNLRKSFCCAGPYDMNAYFEHYMVDPDQEMVYPVGFLCAIITLVDDNPSFREKYGYSDLFTRKLIETGVIEDIRTKNYDTDQINLILHENGCNTLRQILAEPLLDSRTTVHMDVIKEIGKFNLAAGWTPTIPILFRQSKADDYIPFECLESVQANMSGNPVITYDIHESGSHVEDGVSFYTNILFGRYPLY